MTDAACSIELQQVRKVFRLYDSPLKRAADIFMPFGPGRGSEREVLKDVTVNFRRGEVVGILGANGAGKSTLLKIITGVMSPTSGSVRVSGRIAALLELGTGFNPEFTGRRNIYLNGTMMGFTREEMDRRVPSIIAFADIGEFIDQPVKLYSSGMFARLAFAVAIHVDADVLIVDEALSVGDARFQMKCMQKMKSLMDSDTTVLFVSHDINAIRRFCSRALWLCDGRVAADGETNRVCDCYTDFLKLLDKNGGSTEKALAELMMRRADATENSGLRPFVAGSRDAVAEIAGVRLVNAAGEEVEEIDSLAPFAVEVYYDVYDDSVEGAVLGVALKRIDDLYVYGPNTQYDGKTIPWKYGRNCYVLDYPQGIRVLGGGYYLDVGLFDKTATATIQYWGRIRDFTVTAAYIGEGLVILPHEWREKV